ncbi:hypothetical protein HY251_11470 [bacterium]|nr:hypothetical protein [bacterium]
MKGLFTQSTCVLLDREGEIGAIERALSSVDGEFLRSEARSTASAWVGKGTQLVLSFLPERSGHVVVDIVNRPWPDGMGDPKKSPTLFAAWGTGQFGPCVFPGGLDRACASLSWTEGKPLAAAHKAFVRLRTTYALGAEAGSPALPEGYEPVPELLLLTELAQVLLGIKGAIAYWNPSGESIRSAAQVEEALKRHEADGSLPLELWTNVRSRKGGEGEIVMDTVGMEQLDVCDHEAFFKEGELDPGEVESFLRMVSLDALRKTDQSQGAMIGPGNKPWRPRRLDESRAPPRRKVFRWAP